MKKVMLIYPPGKIYQRGEDRSQGNVEDSTATSIRAANDLGYASSDLKKRGHSTFVCDYQTEKKSFETLVLDFNSYNPDAIFMSITNSTVFDDLKIIDKIKELKPNLMIMIKGALFFDPPEDLLDQLKLDNVDYLIGGESDFAVGPIVDSHFNKKNQIETIRGVMFRNKDGKWEKTDFKTWEKNIDELSFPDRTAMNNTLYVRPDTGEPQATISTSRGCGAKCIYCLTPKISGNSIRLRSPKNIIEELKSCYYENGIKNFFFKSDTFTMNRRWVEELCSEIKKSDLNGKIEWVANSRVNPIQIETLRAMKEAGCWLVAFGFESGSPETLKLIKKGATVEDNFRAREMCRQVGLKCFGFFLIGLPWEDWSHMELTRNHMFDLDCDFVELHIAVPYYGTELYSIAKSKGLIADSPLGKDYFNSPTTGTEFVPIADIEKFRKSILLKYHMRIPYIYKRLSDGVQNPKIMTSYFMHGMKLLKNTMG